LINDDTCRAQHEIIFFKQITFLFQAGYTAVVLFAYFDVKNNHPSEQPCLSYWPVDSFELGIPYVHLRGYSPEEEHLGKTKLI